MICHSQEPQCLSSKPPRSVPHMLLFGKIFFKKHSLRRVLKHQYKTKNMLQSSGIQTAPVRTASQFIKGKIERQCYLGRGTVDSWKGWFHNRRRWLGPNGNHQVTLAVRAGQMQPQRKNRADKCLLDSAKSSKREAVNQKTVCLFLAPPQMLLPVAGEESYAGIQCVNSPVCRL